MKTKNESTEMFQSNLNVIRTNRSLSLALLLIVGVLTPSLASAQGVRSKIDRNNGGSFFETQRSSRGINHARDYARDVYQYSSGVSVVTPQVMKTESQSLGQNIVGAQQQMVSLQEQFKDSPSKLESVTTINQHLTKAAELQKELHMECCKETVDGMVCAKCASKIVKELDKAAAEHDALTREVDIDAHHEGAHPSTASVK